MSELRVPDIPLPRPFLRVLVEEPVTKEDVEKVRGSLSLKIKELEGELKQEREINRKFSQSAEVLGDILAAPDFRALSYKTESLPKAEEPAVVGFQVQVNEAPAEYVPVEEIELTDDEVKKTETTVSSGAG